MNRTDLLRVDDLLAEATAKLNAAHELLEGEPGYAVLSHQVNNALYTANNALTATRRKLRGRET